MINRPRDLTRKGLVELQEWFDRQHFEESSLRSAWKATRNEDIAARLIGHIRRAAVGDALKPFDERVDHALTRIKGENDWSDEQLSWLDRLAQALKRKWCSTTTSSKPAISTAAAVNPCYSAPLTTTSTACWISSAIISGTSWLNAYTLHPSSCLRVGCAHSPQSRTYVRSRDSFLAALMQLE